MVARSTFPDGLTRCCDKFRQLPWKMEDMPERGTTAPTVAHRPTDRQQNTRNVAVGTVLPLSRRMHWRQTSRIESYKFFSSQFFLHSHLTHHFLCIFLLSVTWEFRDPLIVRDLSFGRYLCRLFREQCHFLRGHRHLRCHYGHHFGKQGEEARRGHLLP